MKSVIKVLFTIFVMVILIVSAYYIIFIYLDLDERNAAPTEASVLQPTHEQTNVEVEPTLEWNASDPDDDDIRFDVYFGTTSPPPKVRSNQTMDSYYPGKLEYNTIYYWRIVTWDEHNASSVSSQWEFTTEENQEPEVASTPQPSDKTTGVSITAKLGWSGGDPQDDMVTYDVYFGTSSTPSLVQNNQSSTSYNPGVLEYATTYYWSIVTWDEDGASSTGPVWQFTTKDEPGDDDDDDDGEYRHVVFVEEATATTCENCPAVSDILDALYTAGDLDFYYVSLVWDEGQDAAQRLEDEYNTYAFPTVYVDGGYDVVIGKEDDAVYENAIQDALEREVPHLDVSLQAIYDDGTDTFDVTVTIANEESTSYSGTLKVYLTEIVSRWYDKDGQPYSYALVDFVINRAFSVSADDTITEVKNNVDCSAYDPDNLMLFAVVFSDESVERDSFPEDPRPFDAYVADQVAATKLVEGGNLPPEIGFVLPEKQMIHLRGNPLIHTRFGRTILIGKTTIRAFADDDSSVKNVTLSIDGEVVDEDTTAPYEFTFRKIKYLKRIVRRHTFTLTAYDTEGKSSSVSLDVLTFFL